MDNLYALTLRTTKILAVVTALVATATAMSIGTLGVLVWVGFSALAGYYAHHRLGQISVQMQPAQTKSRAMSI